MFRKFVKFYFYLFRKLVLNYLVFLSSGKNNFLLIDSGFFNRNVDKKFLRKLFILQGRFQDYFLRFSSLLFYNSYKKRKRFIKNDKNVIIFLTNLVKLFSKSSRFSRRRRRKYFKYFSRVKRAKLRSGFLFVGKNKKKFLQKFKSTKNRLRSFLNFKRVSREFPKFFVKITSLKKIFRATARLSLPFRFSTINRRRKKFFKRLLMDKNKLLLNSEVPYTKFSRFGLNKFFLKSKYVKLRFSKRFRFVRSSFRSFALRKFAIKLSYKLKYFRLLKFFSVNLFNFFDKFRNFKGYFFCIDDDNKLSSFVLSFFLNISSNFYKVLICFFLSFSKNMIVVNNFLKNIVNIFF